MSQIKAISSTALGPGRVLSRREARQIIDEIRTHLESARALLYKLYEGQGWLSLGYDSWRQCVLSEFGRSESQLYRELSAAKIESVAGLPIGDLPESHVRAVREIFQDDGDSATVLLEAMQECRSADEFRNFAAVRWVSQNIHSTKIAKRLDQGLIGPVVAYRLGVIYQNAHPEVKPFVEICSDAQLASRIDMIHAVRKDLWQEIASTGSVPLYDSVPLAEATIRDLEAWLGIDNAERRAQHVEKNRDYYDKRASLLADLIYFSARLAHSASVFKELAEEVGKVREVLNEIDKLAEEHHDKNRQDND